MWNHTGSPCPNLTRQKLSPVIPRPIIAISSEKSWLSYWWNGLGAGLEIHYWEKGWVERVQGNCIPDGFQLLLYWFMANGLDELHFTPLTSRNNFAQSATLASVTSLISMGRARSRQKLKKVSCNTVGMIELQFTIFDFERVCYPSCFFNCC